jgi:hypothetical protein
MTSPTGCREHITGCAAGEAPLHPPPPPCPFPLPVNQAGQQVPQDPFAGPAVVGPSNAPYQPHAPPGQAGPSVDRHCSGKPPELSPQEQLAAIQAELTAQHLAQPLPALQRRRAVAHPLPLPVPVGVQGVNQLREMANAALNLQQAAASP